MAVQQLKGPPAVVEALQKRHRHPEVVLHAEKEREMQLLQPINRSIDKIVVFQYGGLIRGPGYDDQHWLDLPSHPDFATTSLGNFGLAVTKLETFQMQCLRHILGVSLLDRLRNTTIRERGDDQPTVEVMIRE